jgi:adenylosuccinate synthase
MNLVLRAAVANTPTAIAVTGADYYDHLMRGQNSSDQMTSELKQVVSHLQKHLKTPVTIISTGPETESTIELGREQTSRTLTDPGLSFQ